MVFRKGKKYQARKSPLLLLCLAAILIWAGVLSVVSDRGSRAETGGEQTTFAEQGLGRYGIFDRNFSLLAESLNLSTVYVMPPKVDDLKRCASALAPFLDDDEEGILRRISNVSGYIGLPGILNEEEAAKVRSLGLAGVSLRREYRRFYPQGSATGYVIGFTRDGMGLRGVEADFDQDLRMPAGMDETGDGRRGNIVLTIDLSLQRGLGQGLARLAGQGVAMAAIVAVNSGEILALAASPIFDPNHWGESEGRLLADRFMAKERLWPGLTRYIPAVGNDAALALFSRLSGGKGGAASPFGAMTAFSRLVNGGRAIKPHIMKVMWRKDKGCFRPYSRYGDDAIPKADSEEFLAASSGMVRDETLLLDISDKTAQAVAAAWPASSPRLAFFAVFAGQKEHAKAAAGQLFTFAKDGLRQAFSLSLTLTPPDPARIERSREEARLACYQAIDDGPSGTVRAGEVAGEDERVMPYLVGMSARRALRLIQDLRVRVKLVGSGRVSGQTPGGGSVLAEGQMVTLKLVGQS